LVNRLIEILSNNIKNSVYGIVIKFTKNKMTKINKYKNIISAGNIGNLKKILDLNKLEIIETTETNRIKIYLEFIIESMDSVEIEADLLIKEFCLLEKALGGEYNKKFILKNISKTRYIPIASYDHYRVILFNGMKKLGIIQAEKTILNKEQLQELARTIWH
jgi:hypothetical protein